MRLRGPHSNVRCPHRSEKDPSTTNVRLARSWKWRGRLAPGGSDVSGRMKPPPSKLPRRGARGSRAGKEVAFQQPTAGSDFARKGPGPLAVPGPSPGGGIRVTHRQE